MKRLVVLVLASGCVPSSGDACLAASVGMLESGSGTISEPGATATADRFAMDVNGSWAPDADNPNGTSSSLGGGWHWVAGDPLAFFFDFGLSTIDCHSAPKAALLAATQPMPIADVCAARLVFAPSTTTVQPFTAATIAVESKLDPDGVGTMAITLAASGDVTGMDGSGAVHTLHVEASNLRGSVAFAKGACTAEP